MKINKFNIVIPTRTRCETLYHTIKTALNQDYENLEVIVSDNFSEDLTKDVVDSFTDKRLKYYNTGERLSMAGNFEFALSKVTEGFVMFLGDDDAILPNVLNNINDLINTYQLSAVTSFPATYTWPDFNETQRANTLGWGLRNDVEIRKTSEYLAKFFTFKPGYTFDLPGTYCGFVDKPVLNKAQSKNGAFFNSQIPDAYSAFTTSMFIDEYIYSYKPFVIHGASSRSTGGSYFSTDKSKESNKFTIENTIPFHSKLVLCPSFRVISMETYLQLIDLFPEFDKIKIDWVKFLQAAYSEKKDYNKEEFDVAFKRMGIIHNVDFNTITAGVKHTRFEFSKAIVAIKSFFKPYTLKSTDKLGIRNVYDASIVLSVFVNLKREMLTSRSTDILNWFK